MAGLLGMALAGGLAGGGAAAEDYYRRNDQFDLQRQLMEQQQRWQADREVAMERMRQSGALNLQGAQAKSQMEQLRFQDAGLDRRQGSLLTHQANEGSANRDNQYDIAEMNRASAETIAGGQRALGWAQLGESKRYHNLYIDAMKNRNDNKIDPLVTAQLKPLDAAADDIRARLGKIDDDLRKPEVIGQPVALAAAQAQKKELINSMKLLEQKQTKIMFKAGAISADEFVGRLDVSRITTPEELDGVVAQVRSEMGMSAADKVRASLESAGIRQKIGRNSEQVGPPRDLAPAGTAPTRNSGPLGGILSPYSPRQDPRPGFANEVQLTPAERVMQEEYDAQRQQSRTTLPNINVETASLEELMEALSNGSLSGRQMARARARLSGR